MRVDGGMVYVRETVSTDTTTVIIIEEVGFAIRSRAGVHFACRLATYMTENGETVRSMVAVVIHLQTTIFTRVNLWMVIDLVRVNIHG